jgi:heterodisulfide reductase subunit C
METLRGIARREKIMSGRPIEAFWKAFLDTVRLTGRSFELGVMADYMLRTGRGWGNMDMAPAALARRKLPFLPHFIGGRAEVARIFKRYAEKRR